MNKQYRDPKDVALDQVCNLEDEIIRTWTLLGAVSPTPRKGLDLRGRLRRLNERRAFWLELAQ